MPLLSFELSSISSILFNSNKILHTPGFISENVTRGGKPHIREILGGNMKTHVAVYEEGLFDLRGANAPFSQLQKETLYTVYCCILGRV